MPFHSRRRFAAVPRSVLVAVVAALVSCTDAATVMLKFKDGAMRQKGSSVAVDGTAAVSAVKHNSAEQYNLNAQNFTNSVNVTDDEDDGTPGEEDAALSAVWYLAAFGGLVLFFFVVTCSELFFGNPVYARRPVDLPHAGYLRRHVYGIRNHQHRGYMPDTPPPPYHLFAPPSYDDTVKDYGLQRQFHELAANNKKMVDVYVVPVHAATTTTACCAGAGCAAAAVKPATAAALPQTKFT